MKNLFELKLKVGYTNGEDVNWKICKDNDLLTHNFNSLIAAFLKYYIATSESTRYEVYTYNSSTGENVKHEIGTDYLGAYNLSTKPEGFIKKPSGFDISGSLEIAVGTGTTAPSYSDTHLENEISRAVPQIPQQILSNSENVFTITATIPNTSGQNISECGIYISKLLDPNFVEINNVLIARDTFTAVSIPSNQLAVVQYSFTFG